MQVAMVSPCTTGMARRSAIGSRQFREQWFSGYHSRWHRYLTAPRVWVPVDAGNEHDPGIRKVVFDNVRVSDAVTWNQ